MLFLPASHEHLLFWRQLGQGVAETFGEKKNINNDGFCKDEQETILCIGFPILDDGLSAYT